MQVVKLDVQQVTTTGSIHAELLINCKSVGMLYLTKEEMNTLSTAFESAVNDDFVFGIDQLVEDDEEIDIDIFD